MPSAASFISCLPTGDRARERDRADHRRGQQIRRNLGRHAEHDGQHARRQARVGERARDFERRCRALLRPASGCRDIPRPARRRSCVPDCRSENSTARTPRPGRPALSARSSGRRGRAAASTRPYARRPSSAYQSKISADRPTSQRVSASRLAFFYGRDARDRPPCARAAGRPRVAGSCRARAGLCARHVGEAALRGLQSAVEIGFGSVRQFADHFAGGRIDHRLRDAAPRRNPFAADEEFQIRMRRSHRCLQPRSYRSKPRLAPNCRARRRAGAAENRCARSGRVRGAGLRR